MRPTAIITALLICATPIAAQDAPRGPSPLRVLYVGESGGDAQRQRGFESFLRERFATVRVVTRESIEPGAVGAADVVLLDWHQGGIDAEPSPLGARDSWGTPTVLLGSAGLRTAMTWEVFGGSG